MEESVLMSMPSRSPLLAIALLTACSGGKSQPQAKRSEPAVVGPALVKAASGGFQWRKAADKPRPPATILFDNGLPGEVIVALAPDATFPVPSGARVALDTDPGALAFAVTLPDGTRVDEQVKTYSG